MSFNELLYDFNVRNTLEFLTKFLQKDFSRLRQMKWEQVENVIIFVNILIKIYYDKSYIALRLARDSIIYLRLYHEYGISDLINRKLHYQRIDLFKIFEKIESLAYRLKLSLIMKIHFVVLMTQLESVSKDDFYNRVRDINLFSVEEKDENVDFDFVFKYKFYEIEKLLKRRDIERNIMYLIKWKDCDNEHNVWYLVYAFQKVKNFINECDVRIVDDFTYDKRIQIFTSVILIFRKRDRSRKT